MMNFTMKIDWRLWDPKPILRSKKFKTYRGAKKMTSHKKKKYVLRLSVGEDPIQQFHVDLKAWMRDNLKGNSFLSPVYDRYEVEITLYRKSDLTMVLLTYGENIRDADSWSCWRDESGMWNKLEV